MSDHRILKPSRFSPFFSVITVSAIIFLLYVDIVILIHHDSLHSSSPNHVTPPKLEFQKPPRIITGKRSTLSHIHIKEVVENGEKQSPLIPPFNLTEQERITWFQQRLHEFRILDSDNLSREFHARVLGFFNPKCELQFFMTWISPATLFGSREMLSLESLFKAHPQACLVILSRTLDSTHGYRILKPLIDRGFKVHTVTPDLPFLFKRTPAESWLDDLIKGKKDPGVIPLSQNLSNLIRLVVLYKYGGIYLDTDFIVLKSFKGLRNSIAAQSMNSVSWTRLNNAVLIFDMNHPLLFRFIKEFALTFDGNKWGNNGPYLVSRVVQRLKEEKEEEEEKGLNLTVLTPMAFYPVDWNKIGGWFHRPKNRDEQRRVKAKLIQLSGQTYGVHLWNKWSGKLKIEEGSVVGRLVSEHCVICNYVYDS